jgi:phosphopantothenoylcysteine decarboxylase/phosphopantothenate--cysteine ligase
VDLPAPYGVERVLVETSEEMRRAVLAAAQVAHAVFMVAAVSDFIPRDSARKIKKGSGPLTLTLDEGPDILAELGSRRDGAILVGFAAETEELLEGARRKLEAKHLDWIVANDVSLPGLGIGSDRNQVSILDRSGARYDVPAASKAEVAEAILDRIFGREVR